MSSDRVLFSSCFPRADEGEWAAITLTYHEQAMLWFVDAVSDKPEWTRKVFDPDIPGKWRTELRDFLSQWRAEQGSPTANPPDWWWGASYLREAVRPNTEFSDAMFEYCMKELKDRARIYDATKIMCVYDSSSAVFKSDSGVSEELRLRLIQAAAPLEGDDWHPGSDDKVLDLVHPSLFPFVSGRTRVLRDREIKLEHTLEAYGSGVVEDSQPDQPKFQWLPAEVEVVDGTPRFVSYINNLHRVQHANVYPILEEVLKVAMPMLEATYKHVMDYDNTMRLPSAPLANRVCLVPDYCKAEEAGSDRICMGLEDLPREEQSEELRAAVDEFMEGMRDLLSKEYGKPTEIEEDDSDVDENGHYDGYGDYDHEYFLHPFKIDDPVEYVSPATEGYNLSGPWFNNKFQVIVKLANIHLTPDKPVYDGGSWHIEGEAHEAICATALYYYDSDNITESRLSFFTVADAENLREKYSQEDFGVLEAVYGTSNGSDTSCDVGDIKTPQGRLLTFPNVLQHRVQPFQLVDKTRPGHRKILAFFLIDPAHRVLSTAHVPPQQRSWGGLPGIDNRLPREVAAMVSEEIDCPYDLKTAKEFRAELMKERSLSNPDRPAQPTETWNLCEH